MPRGVGVRVPYYRKFLRGNPQVFSTIAGENNAVRVDQERGFCFEPQLVKSHTVQCVTEHRNEVARVAEMVLRIHVRLALAVFVGHGHQRGHFGDELDGRAVPVFGVMDESLNAAPS